MKVAVFSSKPYDEQYICRANTNHEITFFEPHLNIKTVALATGYEAVCCFVNDSLDSETLAALKHLGISLIAMRCAGFNNVDLQMAESCGITVCRVPEYSPHAVAEHALALILSLNRSIHRAYNRVRENDYSLNGLLGFDMYNKTVGVIGTGKIGATFAKIMQGLGCNVFAYDPFINPEVEKLGIEYRPIEEIWSKSDILSLHCPLIPATRHLINSNSIGQMKKGVMLINTSRGGLIDTRAVIDALKQKHIGYLGLDVYEEESELFFDDNSNHLLLDDVFARLKTFNNVIITGHQAFFTREALGAIASATIQNIDFFEEGKPEKMHLVQIK